MKLYIASGNPHKVSEFSAFAPSSLKLRRTGKALENGTGVEPIEIIPASAVGGMPAVVEDAGTFAGNARKKAIALRARLPAEAWTLADDSGL